MLTRRPTPDNLGAATPTRHGRSRLFLTMQHKPTDGATDAAMNHSRPQISSDYAVDPQLVADAMMRRIARLPEERERYRSALIESLEVLVAGELDCGPGRVK